MADDILLTVTEETLTATVAGESITLEVTETPVVLSVVDGVTDHGELSGLTDDDHPQYLLVADYHPGISRIQDASDFFGSLTDGWVLAWSSAQSKFVMSAPVGGAPGGASGQVQFNNGGGFSGDNGFTYAGSGVATLSNRLVVPVLRPASDSVTAIRFQNAAGTKDAVTVNTINGSVAFTSFSDEVMSLKSSQSALGAWKIWYGTPGNYEGRLKIGIGTNPNVWVLSLDQSGTVSTPNILAAPIFGTTITGRGDAIQILSWLNTGGNFNGTLKIGQEYPNGVFGIICYIGQLSGSTFKIGNNSGATLFSVDYLGRIQTNQAVTNTNTPGGATSKALPIYDTAGALQGYIPVFANQW